MDRFQEYPNQPNQAYKSSPAWLHPLITGLLGIGLLGLIIYTAMSFSVASPASLVASVDRLNATVQDTRKELSKSNDAVVKRLMNADIKSEMANLTVRALQTGQVAQKLFFENQINEMKATIARLKVEFRSITGINASQPTDDMITYVTSHADYGNANYEDNLNVSRTISVQAGSWIKVEFLAFDTEANVDRIEFYDQPAGRLINQFSGNLTDQLPTVVIDSNSLHYVWVTDDSVTGAGWQFMYYPVSN